MRPIRPAAAVLLGMCLLAPARAGAEAITYAIDGAASSVEFTVTHFFVRRVHGAFHQISGGFTLDAADPANSHLGVVVEAASIDTGIAERDAHLRSPDFFDAQQYDELTFTSFDIRPAAGDTYTVSGTLMIRTTPTPLNLTVTRERTWTDEDGVEHVRASTAFEISRSAFGITAYPGVIGDRVAVRVTLEGTRRTRVWTEEGDGG